MDYKLYDLPPGKYYTPDEVKKIHIGTGLYWHSYRLGDTIGGKYGNNFKTINEKWPDSLKDLYMSKAKNKANKIDIFFEIIKDNPYFKFDTSNFLIVGLRLGDVLGACTLEKFIVPLEFYENLDLSLELSKKVVIVCGGHYNGGTPKSTAYLNSICEIFSKKGFKDIFIRAGNSPDDDICFLCGADFLIHGKGSYHNLSRIIIQNYTNKRVITPVI